MGVGARVAHGGGGAAWRTVGLQLIRRLAGSAAAKPAVEAAENGGREEGEGGEVEAAATVVSAGEMVAMRIKRR